MGEWIKADIVPPKEKGYYLVVLKVDGNIGFTLHERRIRILRFDGDKWRLPRHFPNWIHEALNQEVTHWMPLPEPPKMDGDT